MIEIIAEKWYKRLQQKGRVILLEKLHQRFKDEERESEIYNHLDSLSYEWYKQREKKMMKNILLNVPSDTPDLIMEWFQSIPERFPMLGHIAILWYKQLEQEKRDNLLEEIRQQLEDGESKVDVFRGLESPSYEWYGELTPERERELWTNEVLNTP